jgi:N-acyl amino acid synthase of PEP-CTERM/exosortase system
MDQNASLTHVGQNFSVVIADTPAQKWESYRLRYQVYCVERGFEEGKNGIEKDGADDRSRHALVVHSATQTAIGSVRVVAPAESPSQYPMANACQSNLLRQLPLRTTGEVSRFAVSKTRRLDCRDTAMVRLGLMQGIVRLSHEMGLTHLCAIMEPALLRLLRMNSIHFAALGPTVEYHGIRQPAYAHVDTLLDRIRREQWDVWNYITAGGLFCHRRSRECLVA